MNFARWGCDYSENVSQHLFDAVKAWAGGTAPHFWGLYLWDRQMHPFPNLQSTIAMLHGQGCRMFPIFNRVVDRQWPGSAQHLGGGREAEAQERGRVAARKAKELASMAGIPANGRVRVYADLESNNVNIAWIRGWVEEISSSSGRGPFLPGLYGNHRFGWGRNLNENLRPTHASWWSALKIFASQPTLQNPPRQHRSTSGISFEVPPAAHPGQVLNLRTTIWQAWHSVPYSPGHPHRVVDVDLATEEGYGEMF
jgi:hypothetical protein